MNSTIKWCPLLFLLIATLSCKSDKPQSTPIDADAIVESTLHQHKVLSAGYPMNLWEKSAHQAKGAVLFIHGRTWSSLPNFDLQVEGESLSFMDAMVQRGYAAYALDLRGYGSTPRDSTEWLSPNKAATDILNILKWIAEENNLQKVHLFGYSMGSTSSLLAAQKDAQHIASLTVFGYWQDLDVQIPKAQDEDEELKKLVNTAEAAASDFITPGNISQAAIDAYVEMSLEHDPIKVDWRSMDQFNDIDPSLIEMPVLVLQGALDPIAPTEKQQKLFIRLKTAHKTWVVIDGGDHAAFLEKPRDHLINAFSSFIDRFNP